MNYLSGKTQQEGGLLYMSALGLIRLGGMSAVVGGALLGFFALARVG